MRLGDPDFPIHKMELNVLVDSMMTLWVRRVK